MSTDAKSDLSSAPADAMAEPSTAETQSADPIQDLVQSKIAQLESSNATGDKEDEEVKKIAKATKRRLKEVHLLMDESVSLEDKVERIHARLVLEIQENKRLEKDLLVLKRKNDQAQKEKDSAFSELARTQSVKNTLESLCRKLQKQNKMILEDSKRVASDEKQKREELSQKFQTTIQDITVKLEQQANERTEQAQHNEMLRKKLQGFAEQYEVREQHFSHQLRAKDLEQQLVEAKLKQQVELAAQEALKSQAYKEQLEALSRTEADLRTQLALYADKFEQFQDTLTKSNEVFTTFKKEMEKMSKTIKKLEKENSQLRKKCESTDVTLIEMLEERNTTRKQMDAFKVQKERLEALCRTLQTERTNLQKQLGQQQDDGAVDNSVSSSESVTSEAS
eukprot:GILJ01007343.1.p1 GENE.GILJ01007343.1~~GILJ01007343.1.p1  ORF type:complete len:394 (+),score=98.93 GILJ01007343.1:36-1217(+)